MYGFFKDSELVYVGQTTSTLKRRVYKHFNDAKLGKNCNMLIIRAIRKYGKDSFEVKILEECSDMNQLNDSEIRYIKEYSPRYNIMLGGLNGRHSEETKKKISEIQKKKILCVDDQICFLFRSRR